MTLALTLALLVVVYPKDAPYERRDYIVVSEQALKESKSMTEDSNRLTASKRSLSQASRSSSMQLETAEKPLPILVAKVTTQISIDRNNLDKISFEVITKSNGTFLKSVKRSYTNFRSLDDIVNAKYSRQIRDGTLHKRELPESGNMSSIKAISLLREQLNQYLQELLKVTAVDASAIQSNRSSGQNPINATLGKDYETL